MEIKKTSLNKLHQDNKAKFVEFAGYEMPIQYSSGIIEEHKFTRSDSGIFDVSHMGEFFVSGDKALDLLQHTTSKYRRKLLAESEASN